MSQAGIIGSGSTPVPPAFNLVQTQTASNSTNISFTSGLTTYNHYLLSITNLTASVDGDSMYMQLSTNGGSTYINTGYNSFWNWLSFVPGDTTQAWTTHGELTQITLLFNQNTIAPASMELWLDNFAQNANIYGMGIEIGGGPLSLYFNVYANNLSFAGINAFKIYASTGNIATGTFSLYGMS